MICNYYSKGVCLSGDVTAGSDLDLVSLHLTLSLSIEFATFPIVPLLHSNTDSLCSHPLKSEKKVNSSSSFH